MPDLYFDVPLWSFVINNQNVLEQLLDSLKELLELDSECLQGILCLGACNEVLNVS